MQEKGEGHRNEITKSESREYDFFATNWKEETYDDYEIEDEYPYGWFDSIGGISRKYLVEDIGSLEEQTLEVEC